MIHALKAFLSILCLFELHLQDIHSLRHNSTLFIILDFLLPILENRVTLQEMPTYLLLEIYHGLLLTLLNVLLEVKRLLRHGERVLVVEH